MLEIFLLIFALSFDAFIASLAYGTNRIRIPFHSIQIISVISTLLLCSSIYLGSFLQNWISKDLAHIFCFLILFGLGIIKLFDSILKDLIRKYQKFSKKIQFSCCNIKLILRVYANPEIADQDQSKVLSKKEAISLAFALSLDGLTAGIGIGLLKINEFLILIGSLIISFIMINLGNYFGNKLAKKYSRSLSWISGAILILLAFLKR